jgi:hypothetical protein
MAVETVVIDGRFHGPPNSGNGGYVCGVVANLIAGDAEVMLRQPSPLDKPLAVAYEGDAVRLLDGETLVAEGRPSQWHLAVPPPPTLAEAETAAAHYFTPEQHLLPTCFVCGPGRSEKDGLRIFASPVNGRHLVAAPWLPYESLAGEEGGVVKPEFVWAALDCPGGLAVIQHIGFKPIVLGKLATHLERPVVVGESYVVMGWMMRADGRKFEAGTAVYTASGELCAVGKATWIVLR